MTIEEALIRIIETYDSSSLFVGGAITQRRLQASVKSHGVDPRDRVLAIVDATILGATAGGSAENGMSVTLSGIYWKNMWAARTRRNHYSWAELAEVADHIEAKGSTLQFEPGVEFFAPTDFRAPHIANMLQALSRIFLDFESAAAAPVPVPSSESHQPAIAGPGGGFPALLGACLALLVFSSGSADDELLEQAVRLIETEAGGDAAATLTSLEAGLEGLGAASAKSAVSLKLHVAKVLATCRPGSAYEADQLTAYLEAMSPAETARGEFDRAYARIVEAARRSTTG